MTPKFEQELNDLTNQANHITREFRKHQEEPLPTTGDSIFSELRELDALIDEAARINKRVSELYSLPLAPTTLLALRQIRQQTFSTVFNLQRRLNTVHETLSKEADQ